MSKSIRIVHKIDDQKLIQILTDISDIFPDGNVKCQIKIMAGIIFDLKELSDNADLVGRYAFDNVNMIIVTPEDLHLTVLFYRSLSTGANRTASAIYDEFEIRLAPNPGDWDKKKNEVVKIFSVIGSLDLPSPGIEQGRETETLRELLIGFGATHRSMLKSLSESIEAIEVKRAEIEEAFERKEEERLAAHKKALEELEAERANLQLQSYKAERRKILQQMTDENSAVIRKALTPRGAVRARWAVFGAAILLSGFAATLAYGSIIQLGLDSQVIAEALSQLPQNADASVIRSAITEAHGPTNWYLIGRSILSSFVAIGGLVYAAGWVRSFYNSEEAAAREIDRFNYDLVRASWIIETILEVQHEHGGEVPQHWIEGVTRGLFETARGAGSKDDDIQALRALMGFTASASFGPEGPKFDIGRRDAKKLAKAAESSKD